jgi:site-specific recombinase XerD
MAFYCCQLLCQCGTVTFMRAKVTLLARVNDGTRNFPFVTVQIGRKGIALPVEDRHRRVFEPDSIQGFYARYTNGTGKRKIDALGKDPVDAYARFQSIEADFTRVRAGLLPIHTEPETPGHFVQVAAREFKEDIQSRGLKARSIETYADSIDDFISSCSKKTLEEVTERDMLTFIDWMRAHMKKRAFGQPNNTYRNRLKDLSVFFRHFGLTMPFPKRKWPKSTKRNADRYSVDSVNKMMQVGDEDEKDLIAFFLFTGFRDEEAAHAKYSDIDFRAGTINVHDKPEFGWTVKDHEQRAQDIILPEKFIKRMERRRTRYNARINDLIFPNQAGKPNDHLIRVSQRVAKRAGLEERITQHKFRRTFGTLVAKQFGIEQARIWLGHSDISTTQRYLAADEHVTEQTRNAVNHMYAAVGD